MLPRLPDVETAAALGSLMYGPDDKDEYDESSIASLCPGKPGRQRIREDMLHQGLSQSLVMVEAAMDAG